MKQNEMNAVQLRALAGFDKLPDAAHVDVQVVASLCSVSVNTAWRLARTGKLPPPTRLSAGATRWRVGPLREWLSTDRTPAERSVRGATGAYAGGTPESSQ